MKKILFIYREMMMGGSTTSLLSILNELDYSKYSVDLLLLQKGVEQLVEEVPEQVHVLPCAYTSILPLKLRKRLSWKCWKAHIIPHTPRQQEQLIAQAMAGFCAPLKSEYDIAVGFLECWPLYYLVDKVQAKRKVNWIHVDFENAGFDPVLEMRYISQLDGVAMVSNSCVTNFKKVFPGAVDKVRMIPNILSSKTILKKSEYEIPDGSLMSRKADLKFVTVCRIDFKHKGLDRAVEAFAAIEREPIKLSYQWYIIGDGDDKPKLEKMIEENQLQNRIVLLGSKMNPFPYEKQCDIFLLPSHYEGKPMAVTEAQILGLVPCVTAYSAAKEQVSHMVDGIVMENDNESIRTTLKQILDGDIDIGRLKRKVAETDYSNVNDMRYVMEILEGEI